MAAKNAALEGQEFEEVIVPDGSTEGDVDAKDREAFRQNKRAFIDFAGGAETEGD